VTGVTGVTEGTGQDRSGLSRRLCLRLPPVGTEIEMDGRWDCLMTWSETWNKTWNKAWNKAWNNLTRRPLSSSFRDCGRVLACA
jgi:hypothetical protein